MTATLAAESRLLSLGFTRPDAEVLAEVEALARGLGAEEVLAALRAPGIEDDWDALFGGSGSVPPYEGSFEADPFRHLRALADVVGFYRAFGAEPTGPEAERADHVACELEFLSFLELARAQAEADENAELAEVCEQAENAFLRDHLGRFLGAFCRRVEEEAATPFYAALARLGAAVAARELAARGLEPEPLRPRRLTPVEADAFACAGCPAQPPAELDT